MLVKQLNNFFEQEDIKPVHYSVLSHFIISILDQIEKDYLITLYTDNEVQKYRDYIRFYWRILQTSFTKNSKISLSSLAAEQYSQLTEQQLAGLDADDEELQKQLLTVPVEEDELEYAEKPELDIDHCKKKNYIETVYSRTRW